MFGITPVRKVAALCAICSRNPITPSLEYSIIYRLLRYMGLLGAALHENSKLIERRSQRSRSSSFSGSLWVTATWDVFELIGSRQIERPWVITAPRFLRPVAQPLSSTIRLKMGFPQHFTAASYGQSWRLRSRAATEVQGPAISRSSGSKQSPETSRCLHPSLQNIRISQVWQGFQSALQTR
jgi:hypothetical protein